MSSDISLGDNFVWVSNMQLSRLIAFALEVAEPREDDGSAEYVERLRAFYERDFYPGCSFDLAARFPTIDERKFWARCFHHVARSVFLQKLGDQTLTYWQTSVIGDAYVIARLLTRSVQASEPGWAPRTENSVEAEACFSGAIALKV